MIRPLVHITITGEDKTYSFRYVTNVVIKRSREKITDTAEVEIPKVLRINQGPKITGEKVFRRGDKIEIRLGYAPNLVTRFSGYIRKVSPGETLVIYCEDEGFLLKENIIEKKTFQKATLKEVIEEISPIPFEAANAQIGDLRLTNVSTAKVLDDFRRRYGLRSFIQDGVLHVGLLYEDRNPEAVAFAFERNIIDSSLEWSDEQDIRMAAKCVSLQPDNQVREVEIGSSSPTHKLTLFFPDSLDEATLRRQGEEKLKTYRFTGWTGSFKTFGEPVVDHGGVVRLVDPKAQERTGEYWIKSLVISSGVDGYRQRIELDRQRQ